MAGVMYLGNQMISPVILQGSESTGFCPYKVEDGVVSLNTELTSNDFAGIEEIPNSSFPQMLKKLKPFTGVLNFSDLKIIGDGSFYGDLSGCSGLTSIDLSSLERVGDYGLENAFQDCGFTGELDLNSLTYVGENGLYCFIYGCGGLTSVSCNSLESVGYASLFEAFSNSGIINAYLPKLKVLNDYCLASAFHLCKKIENIYFNGLTSSSFNDILGPFYGMLEGVSTESSTGYVTVHFPSNLESTISNLDDYPLFGGSSGRVVLAFDLPATS